MTLFLGYGKEVGVDVTLIKLEIGACLGYAQPVRLQIRKLRHRKVMRSHSAVRGSAVTPRFPSFHRPYSYGT